MTEKITLDWGLQPPPRAVAAWGARAILKDGYVDLLRDRQDTKGDETSRKKLLGGLNDGGLGIIRDTVMALWIEQRIQPDQTCRHLLVQEGLDDGDALFVEADTRASHGYLYIVAYLIKGKKKGETTNASG